MKRLLALSLCLTLAPAATAQLKNVVAEGAPLKAVIIDGQNNHNWRGTTPVLKQILEETKIFAVDVATAPEAPRPPRQPDKNASAEDQQRYEQAQAKFIVDRKEYQLKMRRFRPKFADYQVVVSNYNGDRWSDETESDFVKYVEGGGGLVVVHAADNAFPNWPEYNAIIGLGGWGGRNEKSGVYLRLRDDRFVRDESKGSGGSHGAQHAFLIEVRAKDHPITRGLPAKWMHAQDELYDRLRGPAKNLTVLATAFADPKKGGSGEHEPMLMVIDYGKGRVFHTTLGHDLPALKCVGFRATLARGAEWAATGKVTQKVPDDFPTEEKVSTR